MNTGKKKAKGKLITFSRTIEFFGETEGNGKLLRAAATREKSLPASFLMKTSIVFQFILQEGASYLPQISCSFLLNEARGTKGGNLGFLWYFPSLNATSKDPKRVQFIVYISFTDTSEFPESLVSDSKGQDSRHKTRNRNRNRTQKMGIHSLGFGSDSRIWDVLDYIDLSP